MRLLAEFIMRGRVQAMWMALLGSWIPFLSQASVGLVTLRKGWQEGVLITLVASVPPIIGLVIGEFGTTIVVATIAVFVVTLCTSEVLRALASWPISLGVNMALCVGLGLMLGFNETQIKEDLSLFFANLQNQNSGLDGESGGGFNRELIEAEIAKLTKIEITGAITFMCQMASLPGVLFSRWMQATLYNPGGFQEEFHGLRLEKVSAALCLAAYIASLKFGGGSPFWSMVFATPLVISGFGLMHHVMKQAGVGGVGMGAFYVAFVLFRPLSVIFVVVLSVLDAFFDYRNKFQFKR